MFVGNHQINALDLGMFVPDILAETGLLPRGLTHPAAMTVRRVVVGGGLGWGGGGGMREAGCGGAMGLQGWSFGGGGCERTGLLRKAIGMRGWDGAGIRSWGMGGAGNGGVWCNGG